MPAVTLQQFKVNPRTFHELIIMPQFGDVIDDATGGVIPSNEEGDWMIMDDVSVSRPIIELFGGQNVLKRRDATCKLIYSPVGRLGNRLIRTEKLYAAVEDCIEEFYQGCYEDYEQENFDIFFANIMPILEKSVSVDIFSNKYFGDITRAADVNGIWSWNKFDGIFTHIAGYVASGVIPAAQTFDIASGILTPQQAHDYFEIAYNKQDFMMMNFDNDLKAFYVDSNMIESYWDWLVLAGNSSIAERQTAVATLRYRGIEIRPKKWNGILASLNAGTESHAMILTLKGNFLYGADSKYGGGPKRNEAVRIWWSDDDGVWRRQIHLKAGTEIAAPQFMVFGMTEF